MPNPRRFAGFRLAVGHAVTRWTDGHGRVCALGELPLTCRLHRLNSIASTRHVYESSEATDRTAVAEIFTPDRSGVQTVTERHGPAVAVAGCSRGMLTVSAIIEQAVEECGLAVETKNQTLQANVRWAFERRTRRGHRAATGETTHDRDRERPVEPRSGAAVAPSPGSESLRRSLESRVAKTRGTYPLAAAASACGGAMPTVLHKKSYRT